MIVDLRIPVGGLFALLGLIMIVFGLISDPAIYQRSLGINVNVWWGIVLAVFGTIFLVMGRQRRPPST